MTDRDDPVQAEILARLAVSRQELRRLLDQALELGAAPATTRKDAVRLPDAIRRQVRVIGVTLDWDDPVSMEALLARTMCNV